MAESGKPVSRRLFDLDLEGRPSEEDLEALSRQRPGPMTYEEYFRFLSGFPRTREELAAIPLSAGERFRLD